jgi:hypothetical protein
VPAHGKSCTDRPPRPAETTQPGQRSLSCRPIFSRNAARSRRSLHPHFGKVDPNAIASRVRRKRQRLRSNGSIGSDPAAGIISFLELYRAGLLPIESYRQARPRRRCEWFPVSVRRGPERDPRNESHLTGLIDTKAR